MKLYCFQKRLFPSFSKFNPFQMNWGKAALFITLKRWKSLSINQIIKFATVIMWLKEQLCKFIC